MKLAKQVTRRSKVIWSAFLSAFVFVFNVVLNREYPWWEYALLSVVMALLFWLIFGGPVRPPKPIEDAPPHEHQFRLRYTGSVEGFQIECPRCHQCWELNGDDAFFIHLGIFCLMGLLMFVPIWVPVLRLPEPWDELNLARSLLAAMYIVHFIAWLFLRRRDTKTLIVSADEEEGLTLHVREDSKE